ncbi:hypothetical protein DPM13_00575 [Paracoccus mutanolyticus]|uniref:Uncharacterized protein n=1 Tax=Paracoccus mutanolyticus TaxID=1499308 RepID=A0ABN5M3G6_9RHOB|nr:hypothetical protein DPM13_00575 [Paracoccus mutanolyticus]
MQVPAPPAILAPARRDDDPDALEMRAPSFRIGRALEELHDLLQLGLGLVHVHAIDGERRRFPSHDDKLGPAAAAAGTRRNVRSEKPANLRNSMTQSQGKAGLPALIRLNKSGS